ncbi:MAG TPA: hypothetical protein VFV67_33455 [Actinophytocola sp.]|uniref:hypothetical protein n=1 Tax=Actinophytocola sp. TaxID=1872138 RepID=UPI002DBCBB72|nr:hypothetical protein [Actinophytocola sp.]HEU5475575.1 hypothetical protein [Actinophytocola sp.]
MKSIDCIDLVELVTDALEDALDNETLLSILDHLPFCKGCDDYFNQVLVTVKALSQQPATTIPPRLEASLMKLYREWAERSVVA